MLRLAVLGPHTKILSSLCAACPHSPAGCCLSPPRLDFSDLGRIVTLGGRDWLLEQIAARRLRVGERWLSVARTKRPLVPGGPREAACIYHAATGCTIPHDRRSATCNYYICDEARAGEHAARAKQLHDELARSFTGWDTTLSRLVAERWPEGPPFDAPFLDWLGTTFSELSGRAGESEA